MRKSIFLEVFLGHSSSVEVGRATHLGIFGLAETPFPVHSFPLIAMAMLIILIGRGLLQSRERLIRSVPLSI